ncbi:hypothetical protein PV327_007142 [Microctonus hyperodae]|uniref:C2H2-type domain-containing protein n=1 Tax=Microctonus hyperodae TaxID=165561 RepID=A0AA39KJC0_MICHY|nr:hypothetical protein PV327_007142 [Microctonus hyperodae]
MDESVLEFLREIGVGVRPIRDSFFDESYRVCKVFQRTGVTVEDDETLCHKVMPEFVCNATGCQAAFDNLLNFEVHYNTTHRYTCGECKKIKSSAKLLEIHIQETHDSFFKILSKKQPMYQCYVSNCDIKFINAEMRKEHCISVHKFPKHFRFEDESRQKNKEEEKIISLDSMDVDQSISKLQISKKSKMNLNKAQKMKTFIPRMENTNNTSIIKKGHLSEIPQSSPPTSSSLVFIPRQLTHKPKVFAQSKLMRNDSNVLENDSIMQLSEALPS